MIPTVGRIVLYTLSSADAELITHRRGYVPPIGGMLLPAGNRVHSGDVFPMLITKCWGSDPGSAVNGTVFLDGNDHYWATSRCCNQTDDTLTGTWCWPPSI